MPSPGALARLLPGLALATTSALMLAILLGMAWRNLVGTPAAAIPGLIACLKRPLRIGIALPGLQLTLAQVAEVGCGPCPGP
jgi:uncharacterized membrane protein YadS